MGRLSTGGLRKGLAEKLTFEHLGEGTNQLSWRKSGPNGEGKQEAQSKEEGGGRGTEPGGEWNSLAQG